MFNFVNKSALLMWITQISDEPRGAATGDEGDVRVHGVFPLPMGMEREDRCEQTGLQTWKGSMAPESCRIWSQPGGCIRRALLFRLNICLVNLNNCLTL